jgi:predicted nuclease of predicted toxin-antitoxin system
MKFLEDAGISPKTVGFLKESGHDAVHVREIDLQRASEAEIVQRARQEGRVVLTFDLTSAKFLHWGWPTVRAWLSSAGATRPAHR